MNIGKLPSINFAITQVSRTEGKYINMISVILGFLSILIKLDYFIY